MPSIVTDNVADASLKLLVSSNARYEGFGQSKSNVKGQSCMETDVFGFRTFPSAQGANPSPDCSHACHTTLNGQLQQPFAFEIFINPTLSVLPKFTKRLIKITTVNVSFPQVQVKNSSQKPSKIYGRYYYCI